MIISCTSSKKTIQKKTKTVLAQSLFENQFTGFLVLNPYTQDTIYRKNHQKYFIPASNTKIFTLYTALELLGDTIPGLKYIVKNDTLFIEGTGDPTFLHTYFDNRKTLDFLNGFENVSFCATNFNESKFGPGWAWEDYTYYYQPERGSLPMYGNVATIFKNESLTVRPTVFKENVVELRYTKAREENKNIFYYPPTSNDTIEIPFKTDTILTKKMLKNVLGKKINLISSMPKGKKSTFYSTPTDTVLRRMMHESDNFLAEQLLVLSSSTLSDTLSISKVRDFMLQNALSDLKQVPRWVDGSGLSRYNLFTPESMVQVLGKLLEETPREELFKYFNTYNQLVKSEQANNSPSYIHAKSGGMGNTYNLSGYLVTKSGKTLVFSFMNNHYRQPTLEIKKHMQYIFELLRDRY
ncbi:D-alanyl-D-alanine carboxypeptidase [Costertonia aggregata]|nr:D-alanyl-D-alanine carboxypeptidase [Costertonia aggregata]